MPEADSPHRRPRLLPASTWGKAALLLLILFTLLRGMLWASIQPAFLAPDEDYHWNYVNYLAVEHTVPNLNKGEYTGELYETVVLTHQGEYLAGPRTQYDGHPKQTLYEMGGSRQPAPPKPRQVLEAPLYYMPALAVDGILWHSVAVTRLLGMRWYSAVLGALTVYFAWLLAAAVFSREWERLAATALVPLQFILGFSTATLTNDAGVAAALSATMAWCAWMTRRPPSRRQGIGLGLLFSIAIMTKATLLSLILVVAVTLLMQWRVYPERRRAIRTSLMWIVAIPLVTAGWWYALLEINTGSILGNKGTVTPHHSHGPGLAHVPSIAWTWLQTVYRGYWFDYLTYEVRTENLWFYLPLVGIVIVAVGFVGLCATRGRRLFSREDTEMRPVVLSVLIALLLLLPPWGLDTLRAADGLPFVTAQARFLGPAYPGLAVIAILALRQLTHAGRRLYPLAVGIFVAAAAVLFAHTWIVWELERFYGPIHGHWLRELLHASYDKPLFITQDTLLAMLLGAAICFIAAALIAVVGARRDNHGDPHPTTYTTAVTAAR